MRKYYAIDDFCPHQGASLAAGYIVEGCAVACAWHHWRFSLEDGTWLDNPKSLSINSRFGLLGKTSKFNCRVKVDSGGSTAERQGTFVVSADCVEYAE
ncbi:MAG: Rieske (2Fe-2S) protein [Pirellulaceae bacterium]